MDVSNLPCLPEARQPEIFNLNFEKYLHSTMGCKDGDMIISQQKQEIMNSKIRNP